MSVGQGCRASSGMQLFTPAAGQGFLRALARAQERLSVMIWGAPGIGKSSLVAQVAEELGIGLIDLRLSQLAPTDLRGLPVVGEGVSRWYPPEFLPNDGQGILFLDEINMAPPTMQGVAQQLILDRRVGSYRVPEGWMIWAAGNRKEDRASVYDMPTPLANRFIHLGIEVDLASFKSHALEQGISERIIAFLAYRPSLLHRMDPQSVSWPSPRSWFMADRLLKLDLDPAPAVGPAAAAEFAAYCDVYRSLPDLDLIIGGQADPEFPAEPSIRYATAIGLTVSGHRSSDAALAAARWVCRRAPAEWAQLFFADLIPLLRKTGGIGAFAKGMAADPELKGFLSSYRGILLG